MSQPDFFDFDLDSIVLRLIDPVVPTIIFYHGHGLFELRWAREIKPEELDSLKQNKEIQLRGKLFTPENYPSNWKAIQFVWHVRNIDSLMKS